MPPHRLFVMVRRGLSLPIHLYFVTDRFDKRLHIPVILLYDDLNNSGQTYIHPQGLFFFEASIEHLHPSFTRDRRITVHTLPPGSLRPWGDDPGCWNQKPARKFAPATLHAIVAGSRGGLTQKLLRFGHFSVPFL